MQNQTWLESTGEKIEKLCIWLDRRQEDLEIWATKTGRDVRNAKNLPQKVKIFLGRLPYLWDYVFGGNPVVILGPKSSGKSTLISYLLTGRPQRQTPTSGREEVDRRSELDEQQILHFVHDVGGDDYSKTFWKDLLQEIDPQAIIFILDGRKSLDEIEQDLANALGVALPLYEENRRSLRIVYILLNFFDIWKNDPTKTIGMSPRVDAIRAQVQIEYETLHKVRFSIHNTHLNPQGTSWEETALAMKHFATDLKDFKIKEA